MKIGELAKMTGVAPSAIRFYESIGLVTAERGTNGYRYYDRETVLILRIIMGAQSAGFSLDEIRSLLPTKASGWQHDKMITLLEEKIAGIDAMQKQLNKNKTQLLSVIETLKNRPQDVDCEDRKAWVLESLHDQDVHLNSKKKARK